MIEELRSLFYIQIRLFTLEFTLADVAMIDVAMHASDVAWPIVTDPLFDIMRNYR